MRSSPSRLSVVRLAAATSLPLACGLQPAHQLAPLSFTTLESSTMQAQSSHVLFSTPVLAFARQAVLTFGIATLGGAAWSSDGKTVYDKTCAMCHATGVANAPKLGDKAAWAPRTGVGKEALVATVLKGKGAMPPKAGFADLKEHEIKAALEFMLAALK
jgi:cytochrome c5